MQARVIAAVPVIAAIAAALAPPVTRGPAFHVYADQRSWLGLPHAGDVVSNLPFVLVGLLGLMHLVRAPQRPLVAPMALVALVFGGFVAIGLGSGGYHLAPGDATLAFDWLPIVLTLAWLAALVIVDRIDRKLGLDAAAAFTAAAIAGVVVWWAGGGTGGGDMRWYVATQATLVVVIGLAAAMPATAQAAAALDRRWLLAGVAGFLAARALSSLDQCLLDALGISGHSLKHVVLGGAAGCVLRATLPPRERSHGRRKDRHE